MDSCSQKSLRIKENFDFGWKFFKGDVEGAEKIGFCDKDFRILNLPHDWSIEGPFSKDNPTGGSGGYLPAGVGWYRKNFNVPLEYEGKKVFIEFDGVYRVSDVWINEVHLGRYHNGYMGFCYDMSPYLKYGSDNVIAVRVDNSEQPNSRWYTGSGIYRHTYIVCTDKVHIARWGIYITTPKVSKEKALVEIRTKVQNENEIPVDVVLTTTIFDKDNNFVGNDKKIMTIPKNGIEEFSQSIRVENPRLWSHEEPYLYKVESKVEYNDREVDSVITPIGIRKICFDHEKGFLLNDKNVKLKGVCLHHDGGCVGAAVPERVLERRLELLKEMGCNAIRMSHNPPSPEMLDMCDRMGFLVMDEAFDEWTISKVKNLMDGEPGSEDRRFGYHQYFDAYAEEDLKAMLHRDRNHPCIVLWSVGNEIPEQTQANGHEILKRLVDICHREDPTRPVTSACDQIEAEPAKAREEFLELLDVVGYNYVDRWRTRTETYYAEDHYRHPNRKIIGSENRSINSVRGEYSLDGQQFGWRRGPYHTAMIRSEQLWKFTKIHDYVAGDFIWTGIDYLGESRWPAKNTSCGPLDMCGFPKDSYYFYQSQWTEKTVLHIFPHWNFKGMEGKIIPVLCYTNCDSVELFLNGRSFGEKSYEFPAQGMTKRYGHFDKPIIHATTGDLHLSWDVPYEPGVLKAIGKKDGRIVCVKEVITTGEPAKVQLIADRDVIRADGRDVSHVTVRILDENGNVVPTADNLVVFELEGPGDIIGVDNGKPDDHDSFKVNYRKAFNGLCLAIVQSKNVPGEIKITGISEGLASHTISIVSV